MNTVSDIEPEHAHKWYVTDIQQKLVDHARFGANRVYKFLSCSADGHDYLHNLRPRRR